MKSMKKIAICLSFYFIVSILFNTSILATSFSKTTLENNLDMYATQNKTAKAILKSGEMLIVGGPDTNISKVNVTDSLITFITVDNIPININYEIIGSNIHFYNNTTFSTIPEDFLNLETNPIQQLTLPTFLPVCFLAITDSYNIDSDIALQFYFNSLYSEKSNNISNLLEQFLLSNSIESTPTQAEIQIFIEQCKNLINNNVSNAILEYSSNIEDNDTLYKQNISLKINTDYLYLLSSNFDGKKPEPETQLKPETQPEPEISNKVDNSIFTGNLPNTGTFGILILITIIVLFVSIGLYQKYKLKDF